MKFETYARLQATDMAELLQMNEIHPRKLLEMAFQRLEEVNPSLNAVVHERKVGCWLKRKMLRVDSPLPVCHFAEKFVSVTGRRTDHVVVRIAGEYNQ